MPAELMVVTRVESMLVAVMLLALEAICCKLLARLTVQMGYHWLIEPTALALFAAMLSYWMKAMALTVVESHRVACDCTWKAAQRASAAQATQAHVQLV